MRQMTHETILSCVRLQNNVSMLRKTHPWQNTDDGIIRDNTITIQQLAFAKHKFSRVGPYVSIPWSSKQGNSPKTDVFSGGGVDGSRSESSLFAYGKMIVFSWVTINSPKTDVFSGGGVGGSLSTHLKLMYFLVVG